MKTIITSMSFITLAILFPSCAQVPKNDRSLKPDAEWNQLGIWHRVGDKPQTYVPTGYAASAPRTDREGSWFIDQRDGKKFFVPNEKVSRWEPGVLTGEAKKITDTRVKKSPKTFRTAMEDGASVALERLADVAAVLASAWPSGGGGNSFSSTYGGKCKH